ncbi:MAG TPA: carbamoyltransferase HypF [Gemmatimonadales bacterium]|nr:carbamoyltransferase HypF [Gemmatimonadales bacterium]
MTAAGPRRAARTLAVSGVVQGVGFRPFVHRLALRYGLAGWVRNTAGEVQIHVEGDAAALDVFELALVAEAPPLSRVERVTPRDLPPEGFERFSVLASADADVARPAIPPDVALCAECARELRDPANRRVGYPFITCTDCGPRYTVVEALPYDRARTAMRAFVPCAACAAEYEEPGDRRFHSETNSCGACGPRVWLEDAALCSLRGASEASDEAIRMHGAESGARARSPALRTRIASAPAGPRNEQAADAPSASAPPSPSTTTPPALPAAADALRAGAIVAIRGMGGFHLAVDATQEGAVRRLRERKQREAKPFAVMVASLEEAERLVVLDAASAELLGSRERPIVLLPARPDGGIAASVAPGLGSLGVMLASTPLHLLLLDAVQRPLVMTSGNLTDEPIAASNDEARARLGAIADLFLLHDREIVARCDDSVLRPAASGPVFLRRARGYAPLPLDLPVPAPVPLLAVGAQLKHTFALAQGDAAWLSPHQGDLDHLETLEHVEATLAHYRTLFRVTPEVAVHDLHPGYLSTRLAAESGLRLIGVQHHHAHVAAVMAEHGETSRVVGLAFDGTGYGDDGKVWGAEVLVADLISAERVGQLRYAPLPGGDKAVRAPWRSLAGFLSLERGAGRHAERAFAGIPSNERTLCEQQIARGLNAPLASSMGRLFDAAACALGLRTEALFEGQAAMELEALAGTAVGAELPFPARDGVMDPVPLLVALAEERAKGTDLTVLAAGFHDAVARTAGALAVQAAAAAGVGTVVLGGGTFQNVRLLDRLIDLLEGRGLRVLRPRRLSPNDGAISFGQVAIAAARLSREIS